MNNETHSTTKFTSLCRWVANGIIPKLESLTMLPVFLMRLWVANIFWKSGLTKIDNWDTTVFLFKEEYAVPLLSPEVAAYMGTAGELTAPIMIALGLGGRVGAVMLLIMTAVIEFSYQSFASHQVWALMLLLILFYGPGKISIDHWIRKYFTR